MIIKFNKFLLLFDVSFKIDMVEVLYYLKYLKEVFHRLCNKSVTLAEPLPYFVAA